MISKYKMHNIISYHSMQKDVDDRWGIVGKMSGTEK